MAEWDAESEKATHDAFVQMESEPQEGNIEYKVGMLPL